MSRIDEPIVINQKTARNRVLMPPLVITEWADLEGFETQNRALHYGDRARGGTGTIVIEATAISKEGKLSATELGLWDDGHIPQFEGIAKACHDEKSLVLVQLVHAGRQAVGNLVYSASDMPMANKQCKAMSYEHIQQVKDDFVSASVRAYKAGLDGVEIHGAHGYLLNQFASSHSNKRMDVYGQDLQGRMRLSLEIVHRVRQATDDQFIIGYRFGVNDKTFEEDIIFAKALELAGVDLLNVSAGINVEDLQVPEGFKYSNITFMGVKIKEHVLIPVACVYGITRPDQAADLLADDRIDLVAVGRGLLADPEWTNKAIEGEPVNECYHCKSGCRYGKGGLDNKEAYKCPWRIKGAV